MNMNIDNWELKDSCDDTQFYYESKLNDDMIACIVIPHKGNHYQWLLRIGFKSTFNKWGDMEYENNFDTFLLLAEFMSNKKHLKEIELIKEDKYEL